MWKDGTIDCSDFHKIIVMLAGLLYTHGLSFKIRLSLLLIYICNHPHNWLGVRCKCNMAASLSIWNIYVKIKCQRSHTYQLSHLMVSSAQVSSYLSITGSLPLLLQATRKTLKTDPSSEFVSFMAYLVSLKIFICTFTQSVSFRSSSATVYIFIGTDLVCTIHL